MARYLAYYPAVSLSKEVPARCGDFLGEMTYGLTILPYCVSVLVECIAFFYVNLELFVDARGPNVFEDVMSSNCAFNSERSRHKGYNQGMNETCNSSFQF